MQRCEAFAITERKVFCEFFFFTTAMDEIKTETVVNIDCFDSICRVCLDDVKEKKVFNINGHVIETSTESEVLVIREILSRCTSVEVSIIVFLFYFSRNACFCNNFVVLFHSSK